MAIRSSFNGSLGRNSETKVVGDTKVTKFSVANNTGYGEKKKTQWIECDLWGNRGEKLANYLVKGQAVLVYGEIELHEYTAKDGTSKASLKCRVTDLELLGKKSESVGSDEKVDEKPAAVPFDDSLDVPFN